mgnify:CR=1 FL=1
MRCQRINVHLVETEHKIVQDALILVQRIRRKRIRRNRGK